MVPLGHALLPRPLPALAPRPKPPTPPREADHDHGETKHNPLSRIYSEDITVRTSSNITPNSSAESPNPASGVTRKKVEWDDETTSSPILQPLPVSGERKPIKSILKPYNGVNIQSLDLGTTTKLSPPHAYGSLAAMLESIAQQLAGADRNSKMDAYTTLSGSIKASDNVPELRALKEKLPLLQQFMKRDLTARTATGASDTPLVINDLILLSSFLHKTAIADILTPDFSAYVVDHAIKTFGEPGTSKDVVKHLMFILAQQSFSVKIMNVERVGKLINVLHEIESYVTGKSIVTGRLNIYRNLIRKSRPHMLANTEWIDDLFSDMLSSLKDTRTHAIELGLEAGLVLGSESKASRAVTELFLRDRKDDRSIPKFGEYYVKRLQAMISKKEDGISKRDDGGSSSVPQIWSATILFLRCRPRQLEQWAFWKDWLTTIQECFNCSDTQTKLEANLAWNRLVFAIRPDEKTSPNIINMLSLPLLEQLKRKGKSTSKTRRATLSSICVLLYYSFKPNSTAAQLDLYWDHYVSPIVGKTLTSSNILDSQELATKDLVDACLILRGLFDSTTPRVYRETRAMDISSGETTMEMSELPALDSKWLRKSASRVFPVLYPLLESLYWDLANSDTAITTVWIAYITSIASPAVKEVKVSNETMGSMASIFNFLYRVWHTGPKNLRSLPTSDELGSERFLEAFSTIALSMIDKLGPLPFTEKLLSMGNQDTFVAIATPSHRPRNARGEILCPLHHLFVLLTNVCPDLQYDGKFSQLARRLITPFLSSRSSSKAQMELIKELLELLPTESTDACKLIWQVLADFATTATDTRDVNVSGSSLSSEQLLGIDYRSALKILEKGIEISPRDPLPGWKILFEALVNSATLDAGDSGRAIAVVEPLAAFFVKKPSDGARPLIYGLAYCRMVISKATYPKDRQSLDAARRRLWGAVNPGSKPTAFDPYTHLYDYILESLKTSYESFSNDQALDCSDVVSAITALLTRSPIVTLLNVYMRLQRGIACWIQDERAKLHGGSAYSQAITLLWAKVCAQLPLMKSQTSHSKILSSLELLLCSGLESKHRTIVNASIRLWNAIFSDCKDKLEYPTRIAKALNRLRSATATDLQIPFFPETFESEASAEHRQLLTFADTQDESNDLVSSASLDHVSRRQPTSLYDSSKPRRTIPQVVIDVGRSLPLSSKRPREQTPEPGVRILKRRSLTPGLRHDDSQIQFEAIESSPIADTILDSQILTDRQKEVKERQKSEAAMFPDLRSSPPSSFRTELPSHRSASKTRAALSPRVERQTTPVPQAEEDDFVNSSPTPTRSLHEENVSEPPSSPSEASRTTLNEQLMSYENETDVPSSPPEIEQHQDNETTTSLDPSAQIDPYAIENNRTFSTSDGSLDQRSKLLLLEPSASATHTGDAHSPTLISAEVTLYQSSPGVGPTVVDESTLEVPNTPTRQDQDTTVPQHTPKTPLFHDALTSPASSDKHTINDEVFEDAFSSPRIDLEKVKAKHSSPPLSDIDESSMLRIVKKFDQDSGRPNRRSVRFSIDKENPPADLLRNSHRLAISAPESSDNAEGAFSKAAVLQFGEGNNLHEDSGLSENLPLSSSLPSLIPETPGTKMGLTTQAFVDDDGEELNPNETIIVETPADWEPYKALARKRVRRTANRALASPMSKKRKHEDTPEGQNAVPDSQDVNIKETSPLKRRSPPKKRKPGRPKRTSEVSLEGDTFSDLGFDPAQSFSSVDLDISAQNLRQGLRMEDITTSSSKEAADSSVDTPTSRRKERDAVEEKAEATLASERLLVTMCNNKNDAGASEVAIIAETTIDEASLLESSSAVKQEGNLGGANPLDSLETTATASDANLRIPLQADSSSQIGMVEERSMAQGLRDKLQSLISDLEVATLTHAEVYAIENMFFDAKEKLYGAARRGRDANS